MRKLFSLVEKEVKDLLRDPRIYIGLVVPVVLMPLLGFLMSTSMSSSIEAGAKGLKIAVLDCDKTALSNALLNLSMSLGADVRRVDAADLDTAVGEARKLGSNALLVIRKGFENDLVNFRRASVEVYVVMESISLGSIGAYTAVEGVLALSSKFFSNMLISKLNPSISPDVVRDPFNISTRSILKDKIIKVPPQMLFNQLLMGYSIMIPLLLLMLSITVVQFAATATAVENEEKTLETLLTFPVTRYDILLAKLLGSSILAVIGSILFTGGFILYFNSMLSLSGFNFPVEDVSQLLPPPPPESFILLAVSLLLAILFVTSLGVAIGALSSDVRMANSLLGVVIVPIMIPSFLMMYGDLDTLPLALQLLVYALPTSYPIMIAKDMMMTPISFETIIGIPYSAALTVLVLYATSMLLAPEKLLTVQYGLRLRGARRRQIKELDNQSTVC
ncbi:MAG: ABC transporter permease [Candidatus Brockarchaeota archaeon]|nr:ABC transporter permease [Candidatus Brockarchaeota archaeon]MBO3809387.1 ABC transporter permease [Candidatus Brockarchaeota archaeon]